MKDFIDKIVKYTISLTFLLITLGITYFGFAVLYKVMAWMFRWMNV